MVGDHGHAVSDGYAVDCGVLTCWVGGVKRSRIACDAWTLKVWENMVRDK